MSKYSSMAKTLVSEYSKKGAIAYCEGRIEQSEETIEEFENNGSTALLSDWEDELRAPAEFYQKVKDILLGKKKKVVKKNKYKEYPQERNGVSLEELLSVGEKEIKRLLKGFELWQYTKEYNPNYERLVVGEFVKVKEDTEETYQFFKKDCHINSYWDYKVFREHYTKIEDIDKFIKKNIKPKNK